MDIAKFLAGFVQLLNVLADLFRTEQDKQAGRNEQRLATSDEANKILEKQRDEATAKRDTPTMLLSGMHDNTFQFYFCMP